MTGTTIDTAVTLGITLGTAGYLTPLSIAAAGSITPQAAGASAIYGPASLLAPLVVNAGLVSGAQGAAATTGETGGTGIALLSTAAVTNRGTITGGGGGAGGTATSYGQGGAGGLGVDLASGGSLYNYGRIAGGAGGTGYSGGAGGWGAYVNGNATILNDGVITGGAGAAGTGQAYGIEPPVSGAGGDGVLVIGNALIENFATIMGGQGGPDTGGGQAGIYVGGDATIVNAATVTGGAGGVGGGNGGVGVETGAPGLVINEAVIKGGNVNGGGAGGLVFSGGSGVVMHGGVLINDGYIGDGASTGGLPGYPAVYMTNGTVINAGTIAGGVSLSGVSTFIDQGGQVTGGITADATYGGVLVLAGTTASEIGYIGAAVKYFTTIDFAAGSTWTLYGTPAGLDSGQTISGFAASDSIVMYGTFGGSPTFVEGIGLELTTAGSTITLDITGNFTSGDFDVTTSGLTTTITLDHTVPCFAAGTHILTPRGDIRVENLAVGDIVITKDGEDIPIAWIGHRQLNLSRHPNPEKVQPIRIAASAFQNGVPARDLILSPDHALYLSGCLIPAKALVNGANIVQLNRAQITYYHIELAHHDIIFAEHTAVETYLDTGNRAAFQNTRPVTTLHPDFMQHLRESRSCAPFIGSGPIPASHRARALRRAALSSRCVLTG